MKSVRTSIELEPDELTAGSSASPCRSGQLLSSCRLSSSALASKDWRVTECKGSSPTEMCQSRNLSNGIRLEACMNATTASQEAAHLLKGGLEFKETCDNKVQQPT